MPLQWRNQLWQNLEEGAGKQCSECGSNAYRLTAASGVVKFISYFRVPSENENVKQE